MLRVVARLQFFRSKFDPESYEGLREFYARLVAARNLQIVLKKT